MRALQQNPAGLSILELIQGWKWFAYVPPEAHRWLAERASIANVTRGHRLYAAGDPASSVYAVLSGVFRIYLMSRRGDEITLEEVIAGGWFPHIVPADKPTYALNCTCLQDATVAVFPYTLIAELGRRWPGYYQGLYHEFTSRATATFGRLELLSLHHLNVRLAVYLLRMAHLRGRKDADKSIWVPVPDSQSEIGARVGGTRQRVNSILKAWTQKGIIEVHKDGTRIRDVERLRAEAKKSGFDLDEYLAGWHGGWAGGKA